VRLLAFAWLLMAVPAFAAEDGAVDMSLPQRYTVADAVPGKDGIKRMVVLRGLDKMTGQAANIEAPIGVPVHFATLSITARYCYSTPQSETPETTAFLQIEDHRPDKPKRQVFSGWMLASSPSLNTMQHPLYDVSVISCMTNQPGQEAPPVASTEAVKAVSPNAGAIDEKVELPEGSGQ
jgi:hypothetical protein